MGRHDEARARAEAAGDARRGDRGPRARDVDLRLRRRAVRARHRARRRRAREPRLPRRLRALPDRDVEHSPTSSCRRRRSSRRRAPSRTPSGGSSSSSRRSTRRARRRPTSRSSTWWRRASAASSPGRARGRDGRDRRADAALRGRHLRAARAAGLQWPVAPDGTDSPMLSSSTSRSRAAAPPGRRCPYQAPGHRGERGVPARARHRPPARALQRRHHDPPHRQPRAARRRDARAQPRRRGPLAIADGDLVDVTSRIRRTRIQAHVTDRIEPGHVFTAFHFPEARMNRSSGRRSMSSRAARSSRSCRSRSPAQPRAASSAGVLTLTRSAGSAWTTATSSPAIARWIASSPRSSAGSALFR